MGIKLLTPDSKVRQCIHYITEVIVPQENLADILTIIINPFPLISKVRMALCKQHTTRREQPVQVLYYFLLISI